MPSWLSRLVTKAPPTLLERLEALEREAVSADDASRAQLYNRAGDLCAQANNVDRAEGYYGRAIDAFLQAGYFEPAAAMCRKIIRYSPNVVRARFTLAVLCLGKHQIGDAKAELDAYVRAAMHSGTQKLAVPRLRLMAPATADPQVIEALAAHLEGLGDATGARRIRRTLDGAGPDETAASACWEHLLRAALTNPNDLWKYA